MAKKNERDADRDSSWKYLAWERCVALLPFRVGWSGRLRSGDFATKVERGQPVPVSDDANETERKDLYDALLEIKWLAPKVRNAIMGELGRSRRAQNIAFERGLTLAIRAIINERKILMKKKNERSRGGIHDAAIAEVAKEQGLTLAALKGRLRKKRLDP